MYSVMHSATSEKYQTKPVMMVFPTHQLWRWKTANRLLREMFRISPRRYEVYPTPDGEIAIDAPCGFWRSIVLLCDSDGGALWFVNINGNHRRARYSTTDLLPDPSVHNAMFEPSEDRDRVR